MLRQNKKKVALLVACMAVTVSLVYIGAWAFHGWQRQDAQGPASLKRPAKPLLNKKDQLQGEPPAKTVSPPALQVSPPDLSDLKPKTKITEEKISDSVPQAGNLAQLTSLRANLELAKVQAQIAKEQEKLLPKQPSLPAVKPQIAIPEPAKYPSEAKPSARQSSPVVVSVQGVDGHASATIRTRHGDLVTVRAGQRFADGVVASVTRSGVQVRNGRNISTIAFE